MTLSEAYATLGLAQGTDLHEVQRAYEDLVAANRRLLIEATSLLQQNEYEEALQRAEEAYNLIASVNASHFPASTKHIGSMEVIDNDSNQEVKGATALLGLDESFPKEEIYEAYLRKKQGLEEQLANTKIEKNKQGFIEELNKLTAAWFIIEKWFSQQNTPPPIIQEKPEPPAPTFQSIEPEPAKVSYVAVPQPSPKKKAPVLLVVLVSSVISAMAGIGVYKAIQKDESPALPLQQEKATEPISNSTNVPQQNPSTTAKKPISETKKAEAPSPKPVAQKVEPVPVKPKVKKDSIATPIRNTSAPAIPKQEAAKDEKLSVENTKSEDYKENFAIWLKKANDGNSEAQFKIAQSYEFGYGAEVNMEEAIKWYTKAATKKNQDAQLRLGTLLKLGEKGVKKDERGARRWFELAAIQGNADAQYYLGGMYLMGEGTEKNVETGIKWLEKAKAQNHTKAAEALMKLTQEKN